MRQSRSGKVNPALANSEPIRQGYDKLGPAHYYALHQADYRNPHEKIIRKIFMQWIEQMQLATDARFLDLACGSGEISMILHEAGFSNTTGFDPYTSAAYEARTGKTAELISFEDIELNGIQSASNETIVFDVIICSFAMHLCDRSRMPMLCLRLAASSKNLVILTPHKRPEILESWGWKLINEIKLDRVRLRHYVNIN